MFGVLPSVFVAGEAGGEALAEGLGPGAFGKLCQSLGTLLAPLCHGVDAIEQLDAQIARALSGLREHEGVEAAEPEVVAHAVALIPEDPGATDLTVLAARDLEQQVAAVAQHDRLAVIRRLGRGDLTGGQSVDVAPHMALRS